MYMNPEEHRETTEVRETVDPADSTARRETVQRSRDTISGAVVARRVIWYIAGIIIILLALRIVLLLLAANQGNGFVDFIYSLSSIFASPFYGIFGYTPHYGEFYFEISSVVAIAVYALVAWGLARLFTLTSAHPSEV